MALAAVKCLLVDDVEENLTALCALVRANGVEVLTACSGGEALDLLLKHDVALALLDVQMPEMDGFQLAELMRGSERTRHVPIIFVTAGRGDEHRHFKGYESGAVDFLYKPIEPYILRSKAETFFQLHRQKQQLAEELRERTETLRLNEMFMAVLGHDLRNPLNAVVLCAHGLLRTSPDGNVQKSAGRILASGRRMSRMIEDLLDLARVRLANGIPVQRETADLSALVDRVVREHDTAFPGRRIEVVKTGDLAGEWDAGRLAQVASNLIGNALQYGHASSPVVVRLDGTRAKAVKLTVLNTGCIPPEVLPVIFDPFRGRADRAGRGDGLGLGLYIVRQIVEAHGGTIEVHSSRELDQTLLSVAIPR